jgi:2-amino-4-hydroxy-6-hydroxymethyldihydropteridine diphosphokinase
VSEVEETAPITHDDTAQGNYLNQMIALETTLSARELLAALQQIERDAGRQRDVKWGPRTLDLDIVLFGREEIHSAELTVPHPELPRRVFWKRELDQIRTNHE